MSTERRCKVIHKIGAIDSSPRQILRAICDRPQGHPGWQHKGRLAIGEDVIGVIEWPRVAPK